MSFDFTVSDTIPATPHEIYETWLSSHGHTAMTGNKAATASTDINAHFTAWDGYISGRNIELTPGKRIVQSWRTTKFTATDPDSQIEITLRPTAEGTHVTLHHSNVPDGHNGYRDGGWQHSYFDPMKHYFASRRGHG